MAKAESMKHDDLVRWAVEYLNRLPGSFAYETHGGRRSKPKLVGIADVSNVRGGRAHYYEVKVGDDPIRPAQRRFRDSVVEAGGTATIIKTPEDLVQAVREEDAQCRTR